MDDANGGLVALDAGLDQLQVAGVTEPELVEPLRLGPADITRRRAALRIGVLVMPDQRLPVLVARALGGFPELFLV